MASPAPPGALESASEEDSDSDSDSEQEGPPKRRRLAVPACVSGLFAGGPAVEETADERHQGRSRRVPHIDGNFPSLVYLPVGLADTWRQCAEACADMLRHLATAGGGKAEVHLVDTSSPPGWHVSLSPLLMLRKQFIEPLNARLRATAGAAGSSRTVFFDEVVEVLCSKDGGRYFAALAVSEASARWLRRVAGDIFGAAEALGLAAGEPPSEAMRLHCSLAWTLADLRPGLAACGAVCHESPWGLSWRLETCPFASSWPAAPEVSAAAFCSKVGDRVTEYRFPAGGMA